MRARQAAQSVREFLIETVGEVVAEVILTLLACALLASLALLAHLSWSFSPRLTVAGAALLSLLLAHGAWRIFRDPAKSRRRGLATVTTAAFTLTAATGAFLVLYAPGCDCL